MLEVELYDIFLDFDEKGLSYKGKVKIDVKTDEGLILDAADLEINSVNADGRKVDYSHSKGLLKVNLDKFDGILEIDFEKKIPESLVGIYRVSGKDFMITTQFEASHARDMFPCIDHPAYKARFRLTVKVNKELEAISNMPIEEIKYEEDKKVIRFMETPRMSTYLLYLGISKFEEIRDKYKNVDIIVATSKGKSSRAKIPLNYAKLFLEYYENYYDIPYPLPKLHLIAVPEFAYGAMENWGAITFREVALLVDESSPFRQKIRVATTVAHELAHLWFGDLVTMSWWDDLWLNESFATFMSYKSVNAVYPNFRIFDEFYIEQQGRAMLKDALSSTHPIEAKVNQPEEIEQLFDEISYNKGASILKMIESYLGEETFREGIRRYLKKFSYLNAKGSDLWNSLEEVSKKNVEKIMREWVRNKGYPVVYVRVDKNKIILRQERFSFFEKSDTIWPIPLTLEINGKVKDFFFSDREAIIEADEEVKSLKVNLKREGFYRVFYENLDYVLRANLREEEKFGLVNDFYAFLQAGIISAEEYEKLIRNFLKEDSILVSSEISDQLFNLFLINRRFAQIALEFHRLKYDSLKKKEDEPSKALLEKVSRRLSLIDDEFASMLSKYFQNYGSIDPNLKLAVLISYLRTSGEKAFKELLERYRKEIFDEERERILIALTNAKEPHLAFIASSLVFTGEVKKQDLRVILDSLAKNPSVKDFVWVWLSTNFDFLSKIYAGTGIFGRILAQIIPLIGIGKEEEIKEFFEKVQLPEAISGIRDGLEILKINSRLAKI